MPAGAIVAVLIAYGALTFCTADVAPTPLATARVAIVGAGVGGSSTAFYLRNISGLDHGSLVIDVYERFQVGGRSSSTTLEGQTVELGASIVYGKNFYIKELAAAAGLETMSAPGGDGFVLYNGNRVTLKLDGPWYMDIARLLYHYGLSPLFYTHAVMSLWHRHFARIYDLQRRGVVFDSVEELLREVGLFNYTQMDGQQYMNATLRSPFAYGGRDFATNFAGAINRVNYNQHNAQLNGLAAAVSYIPAADQDVFALRDGNGQLATRLLQLSNATLHSGWSVSAVIRRGEQYWLRARPPGPAGAVEVGPYSAVVVAAPLELAGIAFDNITDFHRPARKFQVTTTTWVRGRLDMGVVGMPGSAPMSIYATDDSLLDITSIAAHPAKLDGGERLYKVFSTDPLNSSTVSALFGSSASVQVVRSWHAYPQFESPQRFAPLAPERCLLTNNAIESAASAMEMSAIAARNAALTLTARCLGQAAEGADSGGAAPPAGQRGLSDPVAAA